MEPLIVSKDKKAAAFLVLFLITLCLATQNGLFGFQKGSSQIEKAVGVVLLGCIDYLWVSLVVMVFEGSNYKNWFWCGVGCAIVVSFYCGMSFWMSLQFKNDQKHSMHNIYEADAASLRRSIDISNSVYNKTHLTRAREGAQVASQELSRIREMQAQDMIEHGIDIDKTNALSWYIAKQLNISYKTISLIVQSFITLTTILLGLSMSMIYANMYTLNGYRKYLDRQQQIEEIKKRPLLKKAAIKAAAKEVEEAPKPKRQSITQSLREFKNKGSKKKQAEIVSVVRAIEKLKTGEKVSQSAFVKEGFSRAAVREAWKQSDSMLNQRGNSNHYVRA